MKKSILLFGLMLIVKLSFTQSLSASKILNFLEVQKITVIKSELAKCKFKYLDKQFVDGTETYAFNEIGNFGMELIYVSKSDELFSIVYKMPNDIYLALKDKLLTKEFFYSYSFKNSMYYESENMRIGINDESSILSFFVRIK
jgi:hypothetical protein